jgi:hypothetical protein
MSYMKGAYVDCPWCYGTGCLQCAAERKKAHERSMQPIFTARRDNPRDCEGSGVVDLRVVEESTPRR